MEPHDIEAKLVDLEIKASYTEDLVDQLNQVVIRQQQQIDALIAEIVRLRELNRSQPGGLHPSGPAPDEKPPHY